MAKQPEKPQNNYRFGQDCSFLQNEGNTLVKRLLFCIDNLLLNVCELNMDKKTK